MAARRADVDERMLGTSFTAPWGRIAARNAVHSDFTAELNVRDRTDA